MNLFDFKTPKTDELFTTLLKHKNIKIKRIVSSSDIKPIGYIQDEDEWVAVLEGKAYLVVNGEKRVLGKGDTLFIPRKTPHTVLETAKGTVWLAIYIS